MPSPAEALLSDALTAATTPSRSSSAPPTTLEIVLSMTVTPPDPAVASVVPEAPIVPVFSTTMPSPSSVSAPIELPTPPIVLLVTMMLPVASQTWMPSLAMLEALVAIRLLEIVTTPSAERTRMPSPAVRPSSRSNWISAETSSTRLASISTPPLEPEFELPVRSPV